MPEERVKTEPVFTERYYSWHGCSGTIPDKSLTTEQFQGLNRMRLRYGTQRLPCCHGQRHFRYVTRFAKDHPDWFCMKEDGTRYLVETNDKRHWLNGKLCYTSPICEELYQDVKAYLTGQPASSRGLEKWGINCLDGRYVDVMPEDLFKACHCPNCQAAYTKEAMYATDLIWDITATMGERLQQEGIKGDLCMMAYPPYRRIPDRKLPSNIQVMVAESGPWTAYNEQKHAEAIAEIRGWSEKLGHKVWLWTYPGKYDNKYAGIPQFSARAYAKFYRESAPYAFGGLILTQSDRFLFDAINVYTYAKLGWDPDLDVEAMLTDLHQHLFGKGAVAMKAAYDLLEELWMTGVQNMDPVESEFGPVTPECNSGYLWTKVYTPARVACLAVLFDAAAKAVEPDSVEARRIALFREEVFGPLKAQSDDTSVPAELARRAVRPDRNILKNGSLDTLADWMPGEKDSIVVADTNCKVAGAASIRIETAKAFKKSRYVYGDINQNLTLVPGKKYRLSYFFKAKDVVTNNPGFGARRGEGAGLCLWEGDKLFTKHPFPLVTGTVDWIHFSMPFVARDAKARLQFRLCDSIGTIWIDEPRIEPVEED